MLNIFYRVRPLKAPIRFSKIETYPDEASALKRAEEIIYACNLIQESARIKVDRVRRGTGSMFIQTIADKWTDAFEKEMMFNE